MDTYLLKDNFQIFFCFWYIPSLLRSDYFFMMAIFKMMMTFYFRSAKLYKAHLWVARCLCPWNFPGKDTGAYFHFLLQGIFPTRASKPGLLHLLHWQMDSLPLHHVGNPLGSTVSCIVFLGRREID